MGAILTDSQLMLCIQLYSELGIGAVGRISAEVMEPNIDQISEKAGTPCDPRYLAYACIHAIGAAH